MKLTYRSRFSSGSPENLHIPNANDEFKQRSYQNSQILNSFKRKEFTKKSNDDYKSMQTMKSRFTSSTSTSQSRAPLRQISSKEINSNFNNLDLITKNKDNIDFLRFNRHNSDDDDLILQKNYDFSEMKSNKKQENEKNTKIQISKAPHVSFSQKIKTSQSGSSSTDNIEENITTSHNSNDKQLDQKSNNSTYKLAQSSKNKANDDDCMSDKIAMLEKKNIVLMTDLRENCQLLSSLQKRLDQSTKDIVTKSNEIVSLKKQISELKAGPKKSNESSEQNEEKEDSNNTEQQSNQLKEQLQKLQQQNEEIMKSNEELMKANEELMKTKEELIKTKEELVKDKEEIIKGKGELEKENKYQKQSIENLNTEKVSLLNQIKEFKAQKDEFSKQIALFKSEVEDLKLQEAENEHSKELDSLISELKKKNKDLEVNLGKLEQENKDLLQIKAENDKLKEDISKFQKETNILNENQEKLLQQNEDLQKRLQELIESNKSQAENIPEVDGNDSNDNVDEINDNIEEINNNEEKPATNGKIYDAYSDLSENESDDNHSAQSNEEDEKLIHSSKQNQIKDHQQLLQQQCFIDDFESQSYASDFSSEFSFTDVSDRNEIMNSPKASIIQQLITANQKNKSLREANAKLESVASTVMSDYTEALNKIQMLQKKPPLSIEIKPTLIYENNVIIDDNENDIMKQKINEMEVKLRKLNDSYAQMKNAHSESLSNFIQKRQEFFKKEIEELNKFESSQSEQYEKLQNQFDSFLA